LDFRAASPAHQIAIIDELSCFSILSTGDPDEVFVQLPIMIFPSK
jgi:hypothetical protein